MHADLQQLPSNLSSMPSFEALYAHRKNYHPNKLRIRLGPASLKNAKIKKIPKFEGVGYEDQGKGIWRRDEKESGGDGRDGGFKSEMGAYGERTRGRSDLAILSGLAPTKGGKNRSRQSTLMF